MNMKADNQKVEQDALEQTIDAGLATFPIEPLPAGFTNAVMNAVHDEAVVESSLAVNVSAIFSAYSAHELVGFAKFLYKEALSVREQIRRSDVLLAALFALLWSVIAGVSIWTILVLLPEMGSLGTSGQASWQTPLAVVTGFALIIETLIIYFYLEQRVD